MSRYAVRVRRQEVVIGQKIAIVKGPEIPIDDIEVAEAGEIVTLQEVRMNEGKGGSDVADFIRFLRIEAYVQGIRNQRFVIAKGTSDVPDVPRSIFGSRTVT